MVTGRKIVAGREPCFLDFGLCGELNFLTRAAFKLLRDHETDGRSFFLGEIVVGSFYSELIPAA